MYQFQMDVQIECCICFVVVFRIDKLHKFYFPFIFLIDNENNFFAFDMLYKWLCLIKWYTLLVIAWLNSNQRQWCWQRTEIIIPIFLYVIYIIRIFPLLLLLLLSTDVCALYKHMLETAAVTAAAQTWLHPSSRRKVFHWSKLKYARWSTEHKPRLSRPRKTGEREKNKTKIDIVSVCDIEMNELLHFSNIVCARRL